MIILKHGGVTRVTGTQYWHCLVFIISIEYIFSLTLTIFMTEPRCLNKNRGLQLISQLLLDTCRELRAVRLGWMLGRLYINTFQTLFIFLFIYHFMAVKTVDCTSHQRIFNKT